MNYILRVRGSPSFIYEKIVNHFRVPLSMETAGNGDMTDRPHEVQAHQFNPDQKLWIASQERKEGFPTSEIKVEFSTKWPGKAPPAIMLFTL